MSQVRLRLLPSLKCMYDEPVQLKVSGLRAGQVVRLRASSTDEKRMLFSSSALYRADNSGEVNLDRNPSLGGSFVGVEPMGLLWSLKSDAPHVKFQKAKALEPVRVKFAVHDEEEEGQVLVEETNERWLMGNGVQRQTVKGEHFRGVLFTPPGSNLPAILDLYTLGGGLSERRAALLASRGFVVLTIMLYGHQTKPIGVERIQLDYFEEAIEFLKQQDKVGSKGVGVITLSKSGDLGLSMASYLSGVDAVVWINGCCSNTSLPLYHRTQLLLPGFKTLDLSRAVPSESGAFNVKYVLDDPLRPEHHRYLIPIERASSQFLFVAAEDDLNWDSRAFMEKMADRLVHYGKDNFECVSYAGAGHYLEPPYGPYCQSSLHIAIGQAVLWGGQARAHAQAEVQLWSKVQDFFKTHLNCEAKQDKAKL